MKTLSRNINKYMCILNIFHDIQIWPKWQSWQISRPNNIEKHLSPDWQTSLDGAVIKWGKHDTKTLSYFCLQKCSKAFVSLEIVKWHEVDGFIKGTQAWNFFLAFFAETETLWSQGPVTRDFWRSYSIRPRYSTFKHFRACSACDEIGSQYAQHAMKLVPHMLSVR
jgi:hypothetical protein